MRTNRARYPHVIEKAQENATGLSGLVRRRAAFAGSLCQQTVQEGYRYVRHPQACQDPQFGEYSTNGKAEGQRMLVGEIPAPSNRDAHLPAGVVRRALKTIPDDRGDFTELFRQEWQASPAPIQWNVSRTRPNVLRGVHVHTRHWDYLCVVNGTMVIGLHDLRAGAPAAGRSALVHMTGGELEVLTIPPGVAHGFYSLDFSTHVIGASSYYDPTDHRRCRWDSPELALDWPCDTPELSPADRNAPSYAELSAAFLAATATVRSSG